MINSGADQDTYEPVADIYLEQAVPDYGADGAQAADDWPHLQQSFERHRDASALNRLGNAYRVHSDFVHATECYEAALKIFTQRDNPNEWATAQHNLGLVLSRRADLVGGSERGEFLRKTEAAFENALRVLTEENHPADWAESQSGLGAALVRKAPRSTTTQRGKILKRAVDASQEALKVLTRERNPSEWAETQYELGVALHLLALMEANGTWRILDRAIASHLKALSVISRETDLGKWAEIQLSLGETCRDRADYAMNPNRVKFLAQAADAYRQSLDVSIPQDPQHDQVNHAEMFSHLGLALRDHAALEEGPTRATLLEEAAAAFRAAAEGYSNQHLAMELAEAQRNLGKALAEQASDMEPVARNATLAQAVQTYETALAVLSVRAARARAEIQLEFAGLLWQRALQTAGDERVSACADLSRAHGFASQASTYFTPENGATLLRQAKRLRRDIEAKTQELGCAPVAVGAGAPDNSSGRHRRENPNPV